MTMNEIQLTQLKKSTIQLLDNFKKSNKATDFWLARDLQQPLDYDKWENFRNVIEKAKMSCKTLGINPSYHFADVKKMIDIGKGAQREIEDVALTRYGCYLVAMNGDTDKPQIAASQAYFAVQTRKQELIEQHNSVEDRLKLRDRVRVANKELNSVAKNTGVFNYAFFHAAGYKGLYGGLNISEIKQQKGIGVKEDLLDRAGHAELAANEFRITQTEIRLQKQHAHGQKQAEEIHNFVGKEVRETMRKASGTMPEDLPAEPPIKQLEKIKKTKELPSSSIES